MPSNPRVGRPEKPRWFKGTQVRVVVVAVFVILVTAGVARYLEYRKAEQCRENLNGIELGITRYLLDYRNGDVPKLELPQLFTTSFDGLYYVVGGLNPYTGEPVKYIPFGDPPSPGDITGYMAEVAELGWVGGGDQGNAWINHDHDLGYYIYMYGPEGEPGLDINWDGVPDGIIERRIPSFPCPPGHKFLLEPLDVVMDRHGTAHGTAPESLAQCAWGKPCTSSGRQFLDIDCVNAEGKCIFCGKRWKE